MSFRLALLLICLTGAAQATDHIIDTTTGREISRADLLAQARQSDFVLLGEIHDNPYHHQRRAALIAELAPSSIAAEHLEDGQRVSWAPPTGPSLVDQLSNAGFDARSWQWPLHEPLCAGLAQARIEVAGANISRDLARRLVREGESRARLTSVVPMYFWVYRLTLLHTHYSPVWWRKFADSQQENFFIPLPMYICTVTIKNKPCCNCLEIVDHCLPCK